MEMDLEIHKWYVLVIYFIRLFLFSNYIIFLHRYAGKDYNDNDQYRNIISKIKEESKHNEIEEKKNQHIIIIDELDEDDMIILCLNELNARIRDFKHKNEITYANKIKNRYDKLPTYHIDDDYITQLKTNCENWLKLFRKSNRNINNNNNNYGR